jgi:hypothetical protein
VAPGVDSFRNRVAQRERDRGIRREQPRRQQRPLPDVAVDGERAYGDRNDGQNDADEQAAVHASAS